MSGLTADARTMIDHARVTSQNHSFVYDEPVGVESCAQAVCDLALRFGESVEDDEALMVSFELSFPFLPFGFLRLIVFPWRSARLNSVAHFDSLSLPPLESTFRSCAVDRWS